MKKLSKAESSDLHAALEFLNFFCSLKAEIPTCKFFINGKVHYNLNKAIIRNKCHSSRDFCKLCFKILK